jgi:hypothetical protein
MHPSLDKVQLQSIFTAKNLSKIYQLGEVPVYALRGVDLEIY